MAMKRRKQQVEPHLRVYSNRSVLVLDDGSEFVFEEGKQSELAKARYEQIVKQLQSGWLEQLYGNLLSASEQFELDDESVQLLNRITDAVTSEVGRAVVGLTVLQLCIKCLSPEQNIRLHKAGATSFSWREGVSMRRLDAQFITPFLRKYDLLRINKDGLFMTRSLAENYPYTPFYKASIRGAKEAWLTLIDLVEAGRTDSLSALKYLLARLKNRAAAFKQLAEQAIRITEQFLEVYPAYETVQATLLKHIQSSAYPARLLEVGMHSFLQVLEGTGKLSGYLLPLCQMRTANKKHRNVADIEILDDAGNIVEAWDCKYGKTYLYDELHELGEKLEDKQVELVGFVVDTQPDLREEVQSLMREISEATEADVQILSLPDWIELLLQRYELEQERDSIARSWMRAYIGCLCQRRREKAPIDEPADQWVRDWIALLEVELRG
jgi:5'-deoxynucleotidase YfbR-like HD superfamily hydrolase